MNVYFPILSHIPQGLSAIRQVKNYLNSTEGQEDLAKMNWGENPSRSMSSNYNLSKWPYSNKRVGLIQECLESDSSRTRYAGEKIHRMTNTALAIGIAAIAIFVATHTGFVASALTAAALVLISPTSAVLAGGALFSYYGAVTLVSAIATNTLSSFVIGTCSTAIGAVAVSKAGYMIKDIASINGRNGDKLQESVINQYPQFSNLARNFIAKYVI